MHPRHAIILELVNEAGRVSVVDLANQLDVSEVTVRQDLTLLEKEGFLRRIHGAATTIDSDAPDHRLWIHGKVKQRLAQRAAQMVEPGETVLVEGGSANVMLAKLLGERSDVAIITPSSYIAHQLRQAKAEVVLLGGQYQATSESLVGPLTRLCIEHVFFNKAFIGVDGFRPDCGFTNRNMMRADVANCILAKGQQNVIITDSSKFGRVHPGLIGPMKLITTVLTDDRIPQESQARLHQAQIELITVSSA